MSAAANLIFPPTVNSEPSDEEICEAFGFDEMPADARHLLVRLLPYAKDLPVVSGWRILVLHYVRDKVGSIIIPKKSQDEDKFQGMCGLVLGIGRAVNTGEGRQLFEPIKIGTWILYSNPSATKISIGDQSKPESRLVLGFVNDDQSLGPVGRPSLFL